MSNEGWSPKPRRDFNLNGIFSYDDVEVKVEKSNRWRQQRSLDGTPHTVTGPTPWSPPLAGPKLVQRDLEDTNKSVSKAEKPEKELDPEEVVKAYFRVVEMLKAGNAAGAIAEAQSVAKPSVRGTTAERSLTADDDESEGEKLEKPC